MQPFSFQCPHCAALLRVKDSTLVGREVPCPDCGEAFRLAYDGQHVSILDVPSVTSENAPTEQALAPTHAHATAATMDDEGAGNADWWKEPHVIAWAVAAVFGICMAVVIATDSAPSRVENVAATKAALAAAPKEKAPDVPLENDEGDKDESGENNDNVEPTLSLLDAPGVDAKGQLTRLGQLIQQQRQNTGHFPLGTRGSGEPTERFSWLAHLSAQSSGRELAPRWDQSWSDVVNQRFVRRRMPVFLNPDLEQLVGENGFPASHFVGIAGVGDDAATLPVSHERAGVFGYDRKTTEADVKDGLAQTMMVAGVQSRLGSWAAGGPATVRGFVDEPYINGPDGFGSGQEDGMWVLMADGSVKFHSTQTDAAILRSEAAMTDAYYREHPPQVIAANEEPVKDKTTEEKEGDETPPANDVSIDELTQIVDEIAETEKQQRAEKEAAAKPPPLTDKQIHARLDQPVLRYRSGDGATFGPVFEELAEMVAVPLDYDVRRWKDEKKIWDHPVQLEYEDVTVGEVFEQLLESVGLGATIGGGKIVIREVNKK
ncbi:hypothetical protein Mal52_36310 [Symmachiella dynata]|uniref:Uncharacterized protein n=1 Tax=Symmachiella dynata TaxID=2527995 RepID=A0A517ZRM7_9PLAN|nr:MJ0042-type zinc finger domain-containing protein [Symmachiella dynata]QDU45142.1 hypothetical protein Mal52_36310 [Symmachiella dynata]